MGKSAKRKQAATMNEMNQMASDQFDYFQEQQQTAQTQADETRAEYEAFEFTNPFADAQNVYAGAINPYADLTNQFAGMQNLYEGMENRFEDMTVDMRAADFQTQQGQQQRANILQGLRGAAGTSGVAGLAQAMAGQGAMQTQQIAAGISQQERQNQMLAAQEGARIDMTQRGAGMQLQQLQATGAQQLQGQQAAGAMAQQQMQMGGAAQQQAMVLEGAAAQQAAQAGQQATLLGMDYGMLAGANAAQQQAMANQMSAMGMRADMYGSQAANNPFSQILEVGGQVAVAKFTAGACIAKGIHVDTVDGSVAVENINIGDIIVGYNGNPTEVLQIHAYKEDPKHIFYDIKIDYDDEIRVVNVGGWHRIMGTPAPDIKENVLEKNEYTGVEFSYDLLTEDVGYRMNGVPVNSMIGEMAELTVKLKNK